MDISDMAQQVVAAQMQMIQQSVAMASLKNTLNQQQQQLVNMVAENAAPAPTAADGRGAVLDILV